MKNVEAIVSHAEGVCKANGARLTAKRKQVLSSLLLSDCALSAYELMDHCQRHYGETPPAMSVYRILDFLEQQELVHKLRLANKYVACSHITCSHEHAVPQFLICSGCQKVREISIQKKVVQELEHNVQSAGFQLMSPQLEMNCLCDDCRLQASGAV